MSMQPGADQSHYDALLEAGQDPAIPCPVCTGDEEAEACSEDCARIVFRAAGVRQIARLYRFCFLAMRLARRYRAEEGRAGLRERAALEQIRAYRNEIRVLRILNAPGVEHVGVDDAQEAA